MHACITIENCIDPDNYNGFIFEDKSRKQCIDAETCKTDKQGYAYATRRKCESINPDTVNGNFI